jgi:hypothetical protein
MKQPNDPKYPPDDDPDAGLSSGLLDPFPGLPDRRKRPGEQHFPYLGLKIDWAGLEVTTDENGSVLVQVTNSGNAVANTPIVEILESPYNSLAALEVPAPDESLYERCGHLVLPSLQPRQTWLGFVECSPTARNTLLIVLCYEPLLDPRPSPDVASASAPDFRKKVDSGWWSAPN